MSHQSLSATHNSQPVKDSFGNLPSLIKNKLSSLECIASVKNKIREQCKDVIGLIKNINKTVKS